MIKLVLDLANLTITVVVIIISVTAIGTKFMGVDVNYAYISGAIIGGLYSMYYLYVLDENI